MTARHYLYPLGTLALVAIGLGALYLPSVHKPIPVVLDGIIVLWALRVIFRAWSLLQTKPFQSVGVAALIQACVFYIASPIFLIIVTYASIFAGLGLTDTVTHHAVSDASSALYFSVITFTTVGYGDLVPTDGSRFFAASEAIVGYISMAALIATIFAVLRPAQGLPESPN